MYAQTNLQLYDQLIKLGYSKDQLENVYKAHNLATELSGNFIRPSGKTHIQHLVGTASVLASINSPVEIVIAGLLHSVYKYGDFGDGNFKVKPFKRKYVKKVVGDNIESYILAYTNLKWWGNNGVEKVLENIGNLNDHEREVVLIRIADVIDEYLDLGNLYCRSPERVKFFDQNIPTILNIAEELGHHQLSEKIRSLIDEEKKSSVPEVLMSSSKKPGTYLVAPLNSKMKLHLRAKKFSLKKMKISLNHLKRLKRIVLKRLNTHLGK